MEEIKQDTELAIIQEKLPSLQSKIEALVVRDEPSSKLMTDYCGFIKDAISKVEEKRKFYTAPLNEAVKRLNNDAKAITAPLSELLRIGKDKLMGYIEAAREREKQEAAAKQKAIDAMAEKNGLPKVIISVEDKRQVRAGIADVHTRKTWNWRIVDEKKIPSEYWIIDDKKLNNMVRAFTKTVDGISTCTLQVPGVEIYQEESIAIRT